ncbi:MBL fold metallo-hydrolase [Candidatus Uabimicrobium amorphum]|uniref:Hydroxyacylglutathione hydrolase n=1 Tax=Uabimicrobium amorphum TaxID=2596890 RepID=A0A5S9IJS7_UABAM|nr:MBL fold metallo-hydrolase [Candidatus Uabimicrobium amorphum]BBM82672.1 hydroxyacylglutathione hydrolase [Candidatus Uabimicrobium amorphum]
MEKWGAGIYLLGQYHRYQTGLWLLKHQDEAAILEMPPYFKSEVPPYKLCKTLCEDYNLKIKYFLCSHAHGDHFWQKTYDEIKKNFPQAKIYLQNGFKKRIKNKARTKFFEDEQRLYLANEPLILIHAPKHSPTDTMVAFRGTMFTGDWELNTIRSVHDGKKYAVPMETRLQSVQKMETFEERYNYNIHRVFSVHANDRRENVNFTELMADTKNNRQLW